LSADNVKPEEEQFQEFLADFGKRYASMDEYQQRFEIFKKNLVIAAELDARSPSSDFGTTKYMDLSKEEFNAKFLLKRSQLQRDLSQFVRPNDVAGPLSDLPDSFDWRDKGVVTDVYNQEQCGSCWAFSTTESIESQWALAGNNLTRLSMQQIVDCDQYDDGCGGGNPPTAYKYVIEAGGLEPYVDYPYIAVGGPCRFNKDKVLAKIHSWQWVTKTMNEDQMQTFTNNTGPPSICVDAATWQYYKGGVITKEFGCGTSLDHCVQLTGWQPMKGMTVWNVRNSWGKDWGENGYLYIEKGFDICGIAQEVTSAIVNM